MAKKHALHIIMATILVVGSAFSVRPYLNIESGKVQKQLAGYFGTETVALQPLGNGDRNKALFYQINKDNALLGYAYLGRVNSCRAGGCAIDKPETDDQTSEYFDYLAILDTSLTVKHVRIIDYKATHGMEISNKGWLKQFIGHNGQDEFEVGRQVDAIAGATISVYAITHDINNLQEKFRQCANVGPQTNSTVAAQVK